MALHIRAVAKHTWLVTLRVLALVLITTVIVLGILVGTEGGRIALVKQGLNTYRVFSGQSLLVTGIRSPALGEWEFGRITMGLANSMQIQVDDLDINWRWQYALQNRWWFTGISAREVAIVMPEPQKSSGEGFASVYRVWEGLPSLRVEQLSVSTLDVARPRYPNLTGEVNAQAEINWGVIPARFLVSLIDTNSGNEYAAQLSANGVDQFRLRGSLLAKPNTSWSQWIKWSLNEPAQASWDVLVNYGEAGQLQLDINDWQMPWQSHLLSASGQLNYDVENIEITFSPLSFMMDGQQGSIAGRLAALESDLSVQVDDWAIDPIVSLLGVPDLDGRASIDATWLGGWRQPRLDGFAQVSGTWQSFPFDIALNSVAARSSLSIESAQVSLAQNSLTASGEIDWLAETLDFDVNGKLSTGPFVRQYMPELFDELTLSSIVNGSVSGAIRAPEVELTSSLDGQWRAEPITATASARWLGNDVRLSRVQVTSPLLQATGSAQYQLDNQQWNASTQIAQLSSDLLSRLDIRLKVPFDGTASGSVGAQGQGTQFEISGDVNVQGLWQQWPLDAQLAIASFTKQDIVFDDSSFTLGDAASGLNGRISWSEAAIDLNLDHERLPLALLPPWFSRWPDILSTFDGHVTGNTRVYGPWTRPAIQTNSEFDGRWFEEPLTGQLKTQPDTNLSWSIEQLDAQWLGAQIRYQGGFLPTELGLDGNLVVEDLSADHVPLLSREFTGSERSLPQTLNIVLQADMAILGRITQPVLSGSIKSNGQLDDLPLSVVADINHLDTRYISIQKAEGEWDTGRWQIEGLYDWSLGQAALEIETNTPDARPLVPWLQLALGQGEQYQWLDTWQGSLVGEVQLDNRTDDWLLNGDVRSSGEILNEEYQLQWIGNGRVRQALNHQLNAQWGNSGIDMSLVSTAEDVDGYVDIQGLTYAQLRPFFSAIPTSLSGDIEGQIKLDGRFASPNINAQINTQGEIGNQTRHPFSTSLTVASEDGQWSLQRTVIDIPQALTVVIEGEGAGTNGSLRVQGVIPDTLYWIANPEIGPGEAVFALDIDGDLTAPDLNGQFEWRGEQWPTDIVFDLVTVDQSYGLNGVVFIDNLTRLKLNLNTPQTPLSALADNWQAQPIDMSVALNVPSSILDPFFIDIPDQQVGGDLSGALAMTGSFLNPTWNGELEWTDGSFEHANYGTRINDINLVVIGNDRRLALTATATDGNQGRIAMNGTVDFTADNALFLAHDLELEVRVANGQLLNQAQMDATVNGALEVTGSYHDMSVSGHLDIAPLNMQTDSFLLDGAPQLNIVQANHSAEELVIVTPVYLPQGILDVLVVADNRVNLYGQGINAELSGQVLLQGDFYDPELSGQFAIVRGTYTGFGKVFQLTEGAVQIQNNQLVLDIVGEYREADLDVTLNISGDQDALSLQLSSDSSADEDELLAQLLFGKVVEELDVIQAIQLASVVNRLRTGDSGLDLVGATRDELSLDALSVDTETDDEGNLLFNVSAGKYLNDYLYLEVEQGVGEDQEFRSSIQYQLLPKTNIELYTQGRFGSFNQNGIELNWSKDY